MKVEGSYTFNATREEVWSAVLDPEVLSNTLPGVQELEKSGENAYKAQMKIRIGPVQGLFNGRVNLSDIIEPEQFRIEVDAKGSPGFVKGEGSLRFEGSGESTILHYNGDAQVGGRLASVGQRLMETSTQALVRQSLESLDAQITARVRGEELGETVEAPKPPSELQFAAGVTAKMLEDLVSPEQRDSLIKTGAIFIVVLFIFRALGNWWVNRIANRVADVIEERGK